MHKLSRKVRFSINPFLPDITVGANSYSSKPAGRGLGIFFELEVSLAGAVEESSGFVINVIDIDSCVREYVVPLFTELLRGEFAQGKHISLQTMVGTLWRSKEALAGKFAAAYLSDLSLKLNPYRKVAIDCEDKKMIYISEKFEFAAMHKLWNAEFSSERNFEIFGKCANPNGHGHNYILDITVKTQAGNDKFGIGEFEITVDDNFLKQVDHKNLNADVPYFLKAIPTVENIAVFAWDNLVGKFSQAKLHCVTVWETDKTYCTYYG